VNHALPNERLVVVVEDSDEDFDTVLEAAQRVGLTTDDIRRAETSDECLKILQGHGVAPIRPALVLLDLNTPGLDGRDGLRAIRSDASLRSIPVVVLTTSGNPRDINACYEHGANACHVKRVRYEEHLGVLVDLLTYWLRQVTLPEATKRNA
jgi:CheY-like chemotaxis protein